MCRLGANRSEAEKTTRNKKQRQQETELISLGKFGNYFWKTSTCLAVATGLLRNAASTRSINPKRKMYLKYVASFCIFQVRFILKIKKQLK